MGLLDYFKTIIAGQIFWAFAVTLIISLLPVSTVLFASPFSDSVTNGISGEIEDSLNSQTNLPASDTASLIYYSGQFVVSLLTHFVFAVPEMFDLLLKIVLFFISLPLEVETQLRLLIFTLITALYFISLINFLMGLRGGVNLSGV